MTISKAQMNLKQFVCDLFNDMLAHLHVKLNHFQIIRSGCYYDLFFTFCLFWETTPIKSEQT